MEMDNKDLQKVVDVITDAMLAMEQRINKRFDKVEDSLESLENEIEKIKRIM